VAHHTYLCEYARTTISCTAARMVGRHGYTEQDREDIEQDLACDLLRRLRRFDPAKGSGTPSSPAASKRRRPTSSAPARSGSAAPCSSAMSSARTSTKGARRRIELMIDAAQAETVRLDELRDDVATAIAVLPANLRSIAVGLQSDTHRVVARRHGISRRQLYHGIDAIRDVFTRCGLAPA